MRHFASRLAVLSGLALSLALAVSCASTSRRDHRDWLETELEARGLEPDQVVFPFRATPEMEAWVEENIASGGGATRRLERVLDTMLSAELLDFQYEAGRTVTAAELFDDPRGNCLAFANLFVAMARTSEVPVYFMDVADVQRFEKDGDLVVVSGHVTAGYGPPQNRVVLEFNVGPAADYRYARPIADLTAIALYYSNRGAEELRDGNNTQAREWLETAVVLDPGLASAWVNLGVARRRTGDPEAAEEAYRMALEVDPRTSSAYQNLAALLRQRGEDEEAFELLGLVEQIGSRNPYNYLSLGDLSWRQGRVEEAGRFYRKAAALAPNEAETAAAIGWWYLQVGNHKAARKWLKRARKADPEHERVRRLAEGLNEMDGR